MTDSLTDTRLKEFLVNASDAISFRLIRSKADFDCGEDFHPEYTHQIFGESEQIFGYANLKVNIWYLADSLSTYIGMTYSSSVDVVVEKKTKGVAADDIYKILSPLYPYEFDRSLVDFTQKYNSESFKPFGTVRHMYKTSGNHKFSVYYAEHGMPDFDQFLDYYKKMESFLLFFVDGASSISTDDSQWCYYTLFEVVDNENSSQNYIFIGYMTVYKFYAYPTNLRPRLSQVLILPPFRKCGHGSELLTTFYRDFIHIPNVRDITVEDPSDDFRRLRDLIDCKRCLEDDEISKILHDTHSNNTTCNGINTKQQNPKYVNFRNKVQERLKINRCQAKRLYEILQLYMLPRTGTAIQSFRDALYKRTLANYERARSDMMCGQTVDPRHEPGLPSVPMRKLFDELQDECFSSQVNEHVEGCLNTYQTIVTKLDVTQSNSV